jgi:hypothetical protein
MDSKEAARACLARAIKMLDAGMVLDAAHLTREALRMLTGDES